MMVLRNVDNGKNKNIINMEGRVAAVGCSLPRRLPPSLILTDIRGNQWKLGIVTGFGGFGDIYLASKNLRKLVGPKAKYIIKVEPHSNGPLFVESHFYIRAAQKQMITEWCNNKGVTSIGVPEYMGSGSFMHNGEKYRFLVIPRYGVEMTKLLEQYEQKMSKSLIDNITVQILNTLEYIHSKAWTHSDIKSDNIMLDEVAMTETDSITPNCSPAEKGLSRVGDCEQHKIMRAHLVDYGLAYRFRDSQGIHKHFVHDERRAHEGTLLYTSRDAHCGIWYGGQLPWQEQESYEKIHMEKESFFSNLSQNSLHNCFPQKSPPDSLVKFMEYVNALNFEKRPDYRYLRSLFQCTKQVPSATARTQSLKFASKENVDEKGNERRWVNLRVRRPCKPVNGEVRMMTRKRKASGNEEGKTGELENELYWIKVLATHPEKQAKMNLHAAASECDSDEKEEEQNMGFERQDSVINLTNLTLTPPPSPSPPSLPTYAMIRVLEKMKLRKSKLFPEVSARWLFNSELEETPHSSTNESSVTVSTSTKATSAQQEDIMRPRLTRAQAKKLENAETAEKQNGGKSYKRSSIHLDLDLVPKKRRRLA